MENALKNLRRFYKRMFIRAEKGMYMNKQKSDILNALLVEPFINQRILAEVSGHSLGVVNRSLKELIKADYLDESIRPTVKAITEFKQSAFGQTCKRTFGECLHYSLRYLV